MWNRQLNYVKNTISINSSTFLQTVASDNIFESKVAGEILVKDGNHIIEDLKEYISYKGDK